MASGVSAMQTPHSVPTRFHLTPATAASQDRSLYDSFWRLSRLALDRWTASLALVLTPRLGRLQGSLLLMV
jgi:hypothetical protein